MKRKLTVLLLILSLLLTGCGWMDGNYVHITAHQEQTADMQDQIITVSSYTELEAVLTQMVESGTSDSVIFLSDYTQNSAESAMDVITRRLLTKDPVGAYAVEDVEYEVGSNSGKPAIAVTFDFRHSPTEIQQIRKVQNMEEAEKVLDSALDSIDPGLVMLISHYEATDFVQKVTDYAILHPESVMELPHVTEAVFGSGEARVVELNFTYRSSRDDLKSMSQQVQPVFEAAKLYVSKDSPEIHQYAQLYSFLMERFDYRIQSSLTPSYSLLHHGVGDSKAFAWVYAAMCRSVDLDCRILNGTRNGEPWTWNLIQLEGRFVHVDLLQNSASGGFHPLSGEDMEGYVWDYSSAPEYMAEETESSKEETVPKAQATANSAEKGN